MLEKILYPTDFSEYADAAVAFMKKLKGARTDEIVLVHIVEEGETAEQIESMKKKAEIRLQKMRDGLKRKGLRIKVHLHVGIPSKEIIRIAEEEKISLIIMGARGKSIIEELLVGSTTEDVVRRAPTHVLVIKK